MPPDFWVNLCLIKLETAHWTPTDDSLVIAVTQKWELRPACGEFLEISMVGSDGVRKGKSVIARGEDATHSYSSDGIADLMIDFFLPLFLPLRFSCRFVWRM